MGDISKFKVEKKTVGGVEYTAQSIGVKGSIELQDAAQMVVDGVAVTGLVRLTDFVLKHVIVDPPNLTMEDFDNTADLFEVVSFGRAVAQDTFRGKEDKSAAKSGGK